MLTKNDLIKFVFHLRNKVNGKLAHNYYIDLNYFKKAKRTIIDLRTKGNWQKDIVIITIDFNLNDNFKEFYNIIEVQFNQIDKSELLKKIGQNGFSNSDKSMINLLLIKRN